MGDNCMKHSWEDNFQMLSEYSLIIGTTRIPAKTKYKGYSIGSFVARCRLQFSKGTLEKKKEDLLKSIGFSFSPYEDDWNKAFLVAKDYYEINGDLLVKQDEIYKDFKLGRWISNQRSCYSAGRQITHERIRLLESIGMVWNANEALWEVGYKAAQKYYNEFGNLDVLITVIYDGIKLGRWISNQRTARHNKDDSHILTEDRIRRLDDIGMIWEASHIKQVSFPEKALFYYFNKIFPNATQNDRSLGFEVDVLDKDHRIGMEYDGRFYHQDVNKDYEKNKKAYHHNIILYRFRENGCPKLMDDLSINIPIEQVDNYGYLSNIYDQVLGEICKQYGCPLIDVDIYRDIDAILSLYKRASDRFEFWYKIAETYYKEHGDLLVKATDEKNKQLCAFLGRMRTAYFGKRKIISQNEIDKLNSIGMVWDVHEYFFNIKYSLAERYFKEHGDLLIPRGTVIDNIDMGNFISVLRTSYNSGTLNSSVIRRMEDIGMIWNPRDTSWENNYAVLKRIKKEKGDINLPSSFIEEGVRIGDWLLKQKQAYWKIDGRCITADRIRKLEELGIDWQPEIFSISREVRQQKQWMSKYNLLVEYIETFGLQAFDTRVVYKKVNLGQWVSRQRSNNELSEERIQLLKEIGITLDIFEANWIRIFNLVKEYVYKYGWEKLTQQTVYKGENIGTWIDTRRAEKRGRSGIPGETLTEEKIALLDSIGIVWEPRQDLWMRYYNALTEYLKYHTWQELNAKVRYNEMKIGKWVIRQRMIKNGTVKTGKLSDDQIYLLEKIGIVWNINDERWHEKYRIVKEFVDLYGWQNLKHLTEYKGVKIGAWVSKQKGAKKGSCGRLKISEERVRMLDEIGIPW